MEEIGIYIVDVYNYEFDESPLTWDDERFMSEAKIQGTAFSLKDFEDYFNRESVEYKSHFIRFVKI